MKRLNAFTILEILVVMFLSSIVIGASYTAYRIIVKQQIMYTKGTSTLNSIAKLNMALNKDIDESEWIKQSSQSTFQLKLVDNKVIEYRFLYDYVVRNISIKSDTFFLMNDIIFSKTIKINKNNYIDLLTIEIDNKGTLYQLHYNKNYGNKFLIENNR